MAGISFVFAVGVGATTGGNEQKHNPPIRGGGQKELPRRSLKPLYKGEKYGLIYESEVSFCKKSKNTPVLREKKNAPVVYVWR